jgi:type II secretory ATPase GspE/PulE/Tfp pilus assembly ATPase PilB-like protein
LQHRIPILRRIIFSRGGRAWRHHRREIKRAAREEGMVFLRESAVSKALVGHTTLHEINKVTFVE